MLPKVCKDLRPGEMLQLFRDITQITRGLYDERLCDKEDPERSGLEHCSGDAHKCGDLTAQPPLHKKAY